MQHWLKNAWILSYLFLPIHLFSQTRADDPSPDNAYDWLEPLEGDKAISWVKTQNEKTFAQLTSNPNFAIFKAEALAIAQSKDRIPSGKLMGNFVYDTWQDGDHPAGLWRRSDWKSYDEGKPQWETLIDLDLLSKTEGKSLSLGSYNCLRPKYERCVIGFSVGGGELKTIREFNLKTKKFIENGFALVSKDIPNWLDIDTIAFAEDSKPEYRTKSGYAKSIKIWKRQESKENAETIFIGKDSDVAVKQIIRFDGDSPYLFLVRSLDLFSFERFIYRNGEVRPIQLGKETSLEGIHNGQILLTNSKPFKNFPTGSLISANLEGVISGNPVFKSVITPSHSQIVNDVSISQHSVYVTMLNDVRNRLVEYQFQKGAWTSVVLPAPDKGNLEIVSASSDTDKVLFRYQDLITSPSLFAREGSQSIHKIATLPPSFKNEDLELEQHFVTSSDGVAVPYFIVHKRGLVLDGSNPTLMFGYGGFEVSMIPIYPSTTGKLWIERGGVFVFTNIRGGGEYGPNWHQVAIRENRQKAFDDFVAIARDLIARKISSPQHLGMRGASNGGLLMGVTATQHPELFNAVICEVPLLNMLKFHKYAVGASWIAEYGDPEVPRDAAFLKAYSPFHALKKGTAYPEIFFMTSTKDDRVSPVHARTMAAKMQDFGIPFLYFERSEGGHTNSDRLDHQAENQALAMTYLWEKLGNAKIKQQAPSK